MDSGALRLSIQNLYGLLNSGPCINSIKPARHIGKISMINTAPFWRANIVW